MPASRTGAIRIVQTVLGLALAGLLITAYADHEARQSIVRLAASEIGQAGRRVSRTYPPAFKTCPNIHAPDEFDILADALAAVEQLGTGIIERSLETLIVRFFSAVRLPMPDLSLGAGQIRPSTVEEALQGAAAFSESLANDRDRRQIALALLERCENHKFGVLVVKMLAKPLSLPPDRLRREHITRLAGDYNAQISSPTNEAAIANYLYRELTYQVFQELRFQRPRTGQVPPMRR